MIFNPGQNLAEILRSELKPGTHFRLWGSVQSARVRTLRGGEFGEQRSLAGSWLIVQGDGMRREHNVVMRVVLSRESDVGMQIVAGELLDAVALETEVIVVGEAAIQEAPASPWGAAARASERQSEPRLPEPASRVALPAKPVRAQQEGSDTYPEAGDRVEHFAFGACEVVKSDGERLHLRADKDGRNREIALEVLKVTLLRDDGGKKLFRLERK